MCQNPCKPNNLRAERTKTDPCADTTTRAYHSFTRCGSPAGRWETNLLLDPFHRLRAGLRSTPCKRE